MSSELDASAIDSTVLDLVLREAPSIASYIRVIATLGLSSSPPWVASARLDPALGERVRGALLSAHRDERGLAALAAGGLARFAALADHDYNDIRHMAAQSAQAGA